MTICIMADDQSREAVLSHVAHDQFDYFEKRACDDAIRRTVRSIGGRYEDAESALDNLIKTACELEVKSPGSFAKIAGETLLELERSGFNPDKIACARRLLVKQAGIIGGLLRGAATVGRTAAKAGLGVFRSATGYNRVNGKLVSNRWLKSKARKSGKYRRLHAEAKLKSNLSRLGLAGVGVAAITGVSRGQRRLDNYYNQKYR